MLRQDQGLVLGQGHQPFGVSEVWVLGLFCTERRLLWLARPSLGFGAGLAGCFAAGLSTRLRGSPTRRALRLGAGFAAAPFYFSLPLSKISWAVTKPPRRSDQGSSCVAALMALPLHCSEAWLFDDTCEGSAEEFCEEPCKEFSGGSCNATGL